MKHELPALPYEFSALEPYIDAQTMEIHYLKHHQAYVDKLNATLDLHPELFEKSVDDLLRDLEKIPEDVRNQVRNFGGGHANHSFFWKIMAPKPQNMPVGNILASLGGYDKFKDEFTKKAMELFGSGWIWLVSGKDQALEIISTPNQNSPISEGYYPLLALDMWEHSYYLKHQNKKADYIEAWWHVVDWAQVEKLYNEAVE